MTNRIGVAFAGGGGKGGYQVGVCKALQEFGIVPAAVSGTSVGALNGSLYAQGRIEVAEKIWRNIRREDVLDLSLDRLLDLATKAAASAILPAAAVASVARFCASLSTLAFRRKGLFSQQGLLNMMADAFTDQPLSSLDLHFSATVHDVFKNDVLYQTVKGRTEDDARNLLLASAALPFIFGDVMVDGAICTDGGWFWGLPGIRLDNTPVAPLFNQGCDLIFLVCLSRDDLLERTAYPNATILPIVPSKDLGGTFDGVMDFSSEGAERRIAQGYQDAKDILARLQGFIDNEEECARLWERISHGESVVTETGQRIKEAEAISLKQRKSIQDFNRMVAEDDLSQEWTVELPAADNLLEYANRLLIMQLDRTDMTAIQQRIADYVDKNQDCSNSLQRAALEAVALLSPVKPQAEALQEQGFFGRVWNGITGRNLKVIAQNQQDLAMAQFAGLALMQQLQAKNLITLEFSAAVNNKLNILYGEVANLHDALNQSQLDIYRSLAVVWCRARKELKKQSERLDDHENRLKRLEWSGYIAMQTWQGREYRTLKPAEQLICLVNDFYQITEGGWTVKELLSLKQVMLNLQLEKKQLSTADILSACLENRMLTRKLTDGLQRPDEQQGELPIPATVSFLRHIATAPAIPVQQWEIELPPYHLALELLHDLKLAGYRPVQTATLGATKRLLLEKVQTLQNIAEQYGCRALMPQLAAIRQQVEGFRFTVPLVGTFSAGKSTLLNQYLGYDKHDELLKTHIDPTTAVATELHYTEGPERLIEHYCNHEHREYPLAELPFRQTAIQGLLRRELHLKNPELARHPDLILVDMPGIGSGDARHEQSIASYIGGESVSFVLCLSSESGTLKESEHRFLKDSGMFGLECGLVINLWSQPDESALQSMVNQAKNLLQVDQLASCTVNALDGPVESFAALLMKLDNRKDEVLVRRTLPELRDTGERLRLHLRILLNEENLSADELKQRKGKIESAIKELQRAFEDEQQRLLSDCSQNLPSAVAQAVADVLNGEFSSLFEMAKNGSSQVEERIKGLATATFQAALANAARERFAKTAREMQRYVSVGNHTEAGGTASFNPDELPEVNVGIGSIGMGTVGAWLLLGPIGGLLAGLVGFFMKRSKENELKERLHEVINSIQQTALHEAENRLPEMAARFLDALKERLDGYLQAEMEKIGALETQLEENRKQDEQQRQAINEALRAIDGLMREDLPQGETTCHF